VLAAAALVALGLVSPAPPLAAQKPPAAPSALQLPNLPDSLKFFVLGDFGTGNREQYELGKQMAEVRTRFPAELVITVGDNVYGSERPQDFKRKFEEPYRALLDAGVKFYASLGNHDSREQARYPLFNMGGRTFYSLEGPKQDVRFLAIESDYPTPRQLEWLKEELSGGADWMIPHFHHPLYSSGRRHGSHLDLRAVLEPLFVRSNVTVVFTGHEHFYERTLPQQGITYFIVGSGGQLRRNNIDPKSGLTARGFDTDRSFLAVEIDGDQLYFSAISRTGAVVDAGAIQRRRPPS
jgi:hypothetical protein